MIEPVARCNGCLRDISSFELTEWAEERARAWWSFQVNGWCDDCTQLEYEIALEEEVKSDER